MGTIREQPQFIVSPQRESGNVSGSSHVRERLIETIETDQILVSEVSFSSILSTFTSSMS